jgi:dTDP-4-dehydrorhamnose reductase
VFLSTNHVFDGSRPHRPADDNRCPANEYGRQKAEAEERLLELGEGVAIVRLTKVLFPGDSRLAGWTEALRRGEAVRAAANLSLAPVPAELAIEGIIRVAESRASGIFQFSAPDETSYFQAAKAIAVTVDAREDIVCDEPAVLEPGPHGEIPRHASLDASRAARELRLTFPLSVDVVLQAAGVGHGVSLT